MTQRTVNNSLLVAATFALVAILGGLVWFNQPNEQPGDRLGNLPITPVPTKPIDSNSPANFGYRPNAIETERFLKTLRRPTIREAGPNLFRARADNEPVLLYRSLHEAYKEYSGGKEWTAGRQGIGDCVSWGWAHGADVHLAVMYQLGDTAKWKPAATEAIYGGARVEANGGRLGGMVDGAYGGGAARWVSQNGGILFRQKYGEIDLTNYSASRAKQWGHYGNGGRGDNGKLDAIAKEHPIKNVALVTNFNEAAAAISAGYPIPVCSNVGFDPLGGTPRDAQGFATARGQWAHCMCFVAVRYDRPGLLCQNSHGANAVHGPKWPADQPDGSFWVDAKTVDYMLSSWRDSFAISGYVGFPYRDLKHADWVQVDSGADHSFALAP